MITHSKRLNTVEEYYFSKKLREVSKMISSGKPVINMGIGSPDLYPSAAYWPCKCNIKTRERPWRRYLAQAVCRHV